MEQENYEMLLQRLNELDNKIGETGKRIDDVTDFNRTLLNTKEPSQPQKSKEERMAYLEKKLKEGLGYAK